MSGLDEWLEKTAAFHTFEACDTSKLELVIDTLAEANSSTEKGSSIAFKAMMQNDEIVARLKSQGVIKPNSRSEIEWDDATLTWLCSLPGNDGLPNPLGSDRSRERLGRFAWRDGNPLSYLLEFISPMDDGEELLALISEFTQRFSASNVGHGNFRNGTGGMCLLGYLSDKEAGELRQLLSRGKWAVSSDEVFDGGVREIAKYLVIVLRQASSRGNGVLLRAHS